MTRERAIDRSTSAALPGAPAETQDDRLARLERENAALRARLAEAERDADGAPDLPEEDLRVLADALPLFVSFVGRDGRYRLVNRAYEQWLGAPREAIQGRSMREVLGEAAYAERERYVAAALDGETVRFDATLPVPDGTTRQVEVEYRPRLRAGGAADGFYAIVADVSDRRRAERTLRQSEARLRLAIDAGRMAIWQLDILEDRLTVSPELNRLLGFPEDAAPTADDVRARYAPGERERLRGIFEATLGAGDRYGEVEFRYAWPDGSIRWMMIRAEIVLAPDGSPLRMLGVLLDITDRKRAEERQHLLLHEIAHRVKNTLATVLALATLTARTTTDVASYRDKLIDRVQGMAKTHDILTANNWEGAALRDVVANEVTPYENEGQRRIHLHGPEVELSARAAVAIGMMMHELATNAAKYGSLSVPGGLLDVGWSLDASGAVPRVELAWRERGGPRVVAPAASGFGSTLIQRGLARELDAEVAFDFAPTGLTFTLSMPLPPRETGLGLSPWSPKISGPSR